MVVVFSIIGFVFACALLVVWSLISGERELDEIRREMNEISRIK